MYTATVLSSTYTDTPKVKVTQVLEYKIGLLNTWTNRILYSTTVHGYLSNYFLNWLLSLLVDLSDDLGHLRVLVYVVIV